jgi:hypothetical protein
MPRASRDVPLPSWLTVERVYECDDAATVDALVTLLTDPLTVEIAREAREAAEEEITRGRAAS